MTSTSTPIADELLTRGDKKSGGGWLGNHRGFLGSWLGWDGHDLFRE